MDLWEVLLLAVVQGVAEFLPISSSGHVVILAALLAEGDASSYDVAALNVALHVGTLVSILIVYFRRVLALLGEDRRLIGLLVAGTLPAVAVGLPVKRWGSEAILENPMLAGAMLVSTGAMLLAIGRRTPGQRTLKELSWSDALWIGASQAAAVVPGLSRSGATISTGFVRGLSPSAAATFSFLLALPAIAGAGLLEMRAQLSMLEGSGLDPLHALLGGAVACAVGVASLRWLLNWLERGRFALFAWWCLPIGAAVVLWRLLA